MMYQEPEVDLSVEYCGIRFENPFVLSSAPPSDSYEMVKRAFDAGWAGAIMKTTSVESYQVDISYPIMTSMDYEEKKGVALGNIDNISEWHMDVMEDAVRRLKDEFPTKVVGLSLWGTTNRDHWEELTKRSVDVGADLVEVSMSCPTDSPFARASLMVGQVPDDVKRVLGWVKEHSGKMPVVAKLTSQVTDIAEIVEAVEEAGGDGVCASDTVHGLLGIDLDTFIPNPSINGKSTFCGVSGPVVKPITLRTLAMIAKGSGIPLAASGGATTWQDCAEYMLVGASTVQFCTAVMHYGYDIVEDLQEGLAYFLEHKGLKSSKDLVGKALPNIVAHGDLLVKKDVVTSIDEAICTKCGMCYYACRDGGHQAYELAEDGLPKPDPDKCYGCALCVEICPVECISLVPRR
jgi:dihydropyrimidine dehydrogenase (NAD+) subunit PreA